MIFCGLASERDHNLSIIKELIVYHPCAKTVMPKIMIPMPHQRINETCSFRNIMANKGETT